jgi:lysyl-tRNA synthetase class 1
VNAEEPSVLWGFIGRYAPGTSPTTSPRLARLVEHAIAYYRDFVRPTRRQRAPSAQERAALAELSGWLAGQDEGTAAETLQFEIYEVGKRHGFANLRDWFRALYEVLLGQSEGPRFGTFVAIYGVANTRALIEAALAREAAVA